MEGKESGIDFFRKWSPVITLNGLPLQEPIGTMLPAGAGEYRSTGSYPLTPMCVITLRVYASKPGRSQQNRVIAPQSVDIPLIQINVPKAPEKVALPVRYTRQAQTPKDLSSGSTPEQWHPPPAASVVAPSLPEPVPAAPPPKPKGIESTSRRSSIRKAAQEPNSNGSCTLKKVHFSISDSKDSLGSHDSETSLPGPPAALPSDSNAMAIGEKPPPQAPPSAEHDEKETDSDFSSDIDDGEMVQQAFTREPQGDNDHLYRLDWGDLDSDSGSAVDGSEPALSVPIRRDVTSRHSFAQAWVSNNDRRSARPAYLKAGEQPEIATCHPEGKPTLLSGQHVPAEQCPTPSTRQPMQPGEWENDSVVGSTIDDGVPPIRAPLTSYTANNRRPISMHPGKVPLATPGASPNVLQGVTNQERASTISHATVNAPSKSPTYAAVGSPQTYPSTIFAPRRRDRGPRVGGLDGTFEDTAECNTGEQFQRHVQDPFLRTSQQRTCEVHYNRRTGAISYEGWQDGYAYVTRVRGP